MKKILIILLFVGCSVTPEMLRVSQNLTSNKIKSIYMGLEVDNLFRNESIISIEPLTVQNYFATILNRSLEQNICQKSRNKWGYIDAKITFHKTSPSNNTLLLGIGTVGIMPLIHLFCGIPFEIKTVTEVEFTIYDSARRPIKKYTILKRLNSLTSWGIGKKRRTVKNYKAIISELENRISLDASYINSEFEKSGTIK